MVGGILVYSRKNIPSKLTLIEKENYIVALSKFIDYHTRLSCIFEAALFDFQVMNFSLVWKAFKKFRTRVMTTIKSFRMKCSRSSCQRCFFKKRLQHMFSCEYSEVFKNVYIEEHLWTAASGVQRELNVRWWTMFEMFKIFKDF